MSAVQSISWDNLIDIVIEAKERIYIVMPSLHHEWVEMLKMCKTETEIYLCIENSEEVTRKGYGDTRQVKECLKNNFTVFESNDLKIQFLYVDNRGWALYTESHILSGELKGYNAIELPEETSQQIIQAFFPSQNKSPESVYSKPLDVIKLAEVEYYLNANPPIEPDIQRLVLVYSNYFQFVEIELKKSTFLEKKISLPEKELKYWGDNISKDVQSKLTLFSKEDKSNIHEMRSIANMLESCKQKHLTKFPFRKNKYILCNSEKDAFLQNIDSIKKEIHQSKSDIIDTIEIYITKKRTEIVTALTNSLQNNEQLLKESKKVLYQQQYIENRIRNIINKIKFPTPSSLIENMEIAIHFYDLTFEDINDPIIKSWFMENKLPKRCNCEDISHFEQTFSQKL